MASEFDRKRSKGGEEASARRTKRARLDEERTSSEGELALHPNDEDLFSLALAGKEPSDVSPDSYPSSDGGSFQLTKAEVEGVREEKKKTRKYRGATEEVLEAERERDRREREQKSEERRRYRGDEKERGYKISSGPRSSPRRDDNRGGRERRGQENRNLLYPHDERYYSRDFRRGDIRRHEGRGEDYHSAHRKGDVGRWGGGRRGREREESYRMGYRHPISPRLGDFGRPEWRQSKKGVPDREIHGEKHGRGDRSAERVGYERERAERKHRKRKRSREEREEKTEMEGDQISGSEGSEKRGTGSPRDQIEDWIKELQEGDDSGSQEQTHNNSSSEEDRQSSDEDGEKEQRTPEEDLLSVSHDEQSEEGEIVDSSEESGEYSSYKRLGVTEPILRSKFDESSGSSSDEEVQHKPKKKSNVAFSQKAQVAYSGYTEVVSGSDESDGEISEKAPEVVEGVPEVEKLEEKAMQEDEEEEEDDEFKNLPPYLPALMGCRNVEEYEWLNRIEEGTYGVVYRARDKRSSEIVALKKLKMEKEKEGFPITSLREINMLLKAKHPNVVFVRELVVGSNMDRIYIVMDYVEHDLKALMETMKQPFLEGEVKMLLLQLLRAVHHLHDNWILHRDLKTSNLLLSHKGILKVGDFGLAREYGSPLKPYTPVVVTLWYRAPELLLGCKTYSTPIDLWSVGCIFAEFLQHKPIFMGKSEIDQLNQIFKELGTPSEEIWTGYNELPVVKKVTFTKQPYNNLRKRFPYLTQSGFDLLNKFLTYDPKRRITGEKALEDPYFKESPLPVDPSMFPTWPAKSEKTRRKSREKSPTPPIGGNYLLSQAEEDGFKITSALHGKAAVGAGFSLKF